MCLKSPSAWETIDFHDSRVLEHFLAQSKADNVLRGLRAAYANVGDGRLPTLSELLNHSSGLPEYLAVAPAGSVRQIVDGLCGVRAPEDPELHRAESIEELERLIGDRLATGHPPLFPPGSKHHHSAVGYALLRFVFDDWRSKESCYGLGYILDTCKLMGMQTACFEVAHERCAPWRNGKRMEQLFSDCPDHSRHVQLYAPADGLCARVDELAACLSDRNPWRDSSTACDEATGLDTLFFLPMTLVPRVLVDDPLDPRCFHSHGWTNFAARAGDREVRVLCACGSFGDSHSTVLAMVPALGVSFALGTTATLPALAASAPGGLAKFVGDAVGVIVRSIEPIETSAMKPALVFSPEVNLMLSRPPPSGRYSRETLRRAVDPTWIFAKAPEQLHNSFAGKEFVALYDDGALSVDTPDSRLRRLRIDAARLDASKYSGKRVPVLLARHLKKAAGAGTRYALTELDPATGETATWILAWDPAAYPSVAAMDASLTAARLPGARLEGAGVYRAVDPADGIAGENVELLMYRIDNDMYERFLEARGETASDGEPIIAFRGQVYVRKTLHRFIAKRASPSEADRAEDTRDRFLRATELVSAPLEDPAPKLSVSKLLAAPRDLPATKPTKEWIGPFVGGIALGALLVRPWAAPYFPDAAPYYAPAAYIVPPYAPAL